MMNRKSPYLIWLVIFLLFLLVVSCDGLTTGTTSDDLNTELKLQATVRAITDMTEQANANAQAAQNRKAAEQAIQGTQVALAVQGTSVAQQAAALTQSASNSQNTSPDQQSLPVVQVNPPAEAQNSGAAQSIPPAQEPAAAQEAPKNTLEPFDQWKMKASILVYEDMAGVLNNNRTVKDAFEALGIKITKDEKDASGFFLSDIRSGGPGGKPWDLIVSASEVRTAIQGEFIPPLNEAVSNGSSLIMEQWNLDSINFGKISTLMMRCGVALHQDKAYTPVNCARPADEYPLVLWAIDGTSPILHDPNDGLRLSSMSRYWTDWYENQCLQGAWLAPWDYGDELKLTSGSKARVILGTKSTDTDRHAMLVSCIDDRVILWTSSTHNYANDRVLPLWMNMIQNALKARYDYLSKQQ